MYNSLKRYEGGGIVTKPRNNRGRLMLLEQMLLVLTGEITESEAVDNLMERLDPDYELKHACRVLGIPEPDTQR